MRNWILFTLMISAVIFSSSDPAWAGGESKARPIRAIHVVLRYLSVAEVKRLIGLATSADFNTMIIDPRDQVKFESFPGKVLQNAWLTDDFVNVVDFARSHGLEVIPEVSLLTHQEQLLGKSNQGLMFDKTTYDPRNNKVYEHIFPYLDELIRLIHPHAIHIGHDEIQGAYKAKKRFGMVNDLLPADLFWKDVSLIHGYLRERDIDTWMWGDMLVSPGELPSMKSNHFNGVGNYGGPLRDKLPKDIVICDWHYETENESFPSIDLFRSAGFRVMGVTFNESKTIANFSHYAARHGADGMIATIWFYLQRKEWGTVESIVRESGEIFLREFPDEKN